MKAHFSFGLSVLPVSVTDRDIREGIARSCTNCAVARALYRTLPHFGFVGLDVEFVPYACWMEPRGLELWKDWRRNLVGRLDVRDFPSGLIEWAMDFDEWSEFHYEYGGSIRTWREDHGRDADRPFRPEPTRFVFDFTKLKTD